MKSLGSRKREDYKQRKQQKVIWAHTQIASDKNNKTNTRHDVDIEKNNQLGNSNKKRPPKRKHKTSRNFRQRLILKQDTQK